MGIFHKQKQGIGSAEQRRYPRRQSDGTQVYLYARGGGSQRCRVRDISRAGMFIETDASLALALPVELAFTCLHTHCIVKIYRRSGYVARAADDGVVVLFFNRYLARDSAR